MRSGRPASGPSPRCRRASGSKWSRSGSRRGRSEPMSAHPLDSASLEVLWTRLISIADEAAAVLVRTSFSTVVRESHDFSCVLTDTNGRSIAQATDSIPSFISTLPRTVRHFLRELPPQTLAFGDVRNGPRRAQHHQGDGRTRGVAPPRRVDVLPSAPAVRIRTAELAETGGVFQDLVRRQMA